MASFSAVFLISVMAVLAQSTVSRASDKDRHELTAEGSPSSKIQNDAEENTNSGADSDALAFPSRPIVPPAESATYRREVKRLYHELMGFKASPRFRENGFAAGGYKSWLTQVKALVASANYEAAAGCLLQLGFGYLQSGGQETVHSRWAKKWVILPYIGDGKKHIAKSKLKKSGKKKIIEGREKARAIIKESDAEHVTFQQLAEAFVKEGIASSEKNKLWDSIGFKDWGALEEDDYSDPEIQSVLLLILAIDDEQARQDSKDK